MLIRRDMGGCAQSVKRISLYRYFGGKCSLLRKLAPIHLCCSGAPSVFSFPGSKHTARITRNTCLPASARARESEVQGRGGGAYIQHASSRSSPHLLCVLHARTRVRFAQGLPDFPPELSSFPFHCFLLLLLLIRPSLPSVRRRFRILGARARCFTASSGSR